MYALYSGGREVVSGYLTLAGAKRVLREARSVDPKGRYEVKRDPSAEPRSFTREHRL
jgi:hypothetical protein